ncbi:chromosome segregation protein SMC [Desulfobacter hydrogenophilus]|uniref:Chromosome segregation protein SMC n=1 Tax=Desulfobacter hydrogenophilus TaxID=2291 RepID=A0A328F8V8_9BACT|nr:YhaN family protein [Desulfobacter hydrogenophilus]NDY74145.1 AAA family ATPase [Desulfobacter hydrogenophilus]QBH15329.1 chromosome segregation protein SMC [Desulfobacter hydrogenophilus]RAM00799.1 chromosome segregation protein SMC [Desulfobacter hydrogenophilus]
MRINRLDLMAFGHFTEKSLDLSDGNLGLHIIYGDNEAGKSTSLRALIGWLFGIQTRTKDNFLHSNPQLRIGGELQFLNGQKFEFIRRKGNKDTLLNFGSNEPLDENRFTRFLPAGIDETLFTKLWGIDHGRLIAGGQELLEQSGDLGQALFSAAVGTADFRKILEGMQNSAAEIFKPRSSKALLNKAISDYKDAQKRMRDAILPVSNWKALQKELSKSNADISGVEQKITETNKQKNRLERINRVKGALAQRRNYLAKIEELGPVLLLPQDFTDQHKTAVETLQNALDLKERLGVKLAALNKESGALSVRDDLLKNEDAILMLYKNLGAVEKTNADRPQQDGKRRLLRNDAQTLLKGIRPDMDLDDADQLRPLLNNKKWISGLVRKNSLLIQKEAGFKAALKDLLDEQKSLKSKLEDISQSQIDLTQLKASIASARKAGDIEQRLDDITIQAAQENAAGKNEFARLGNYHGTADALLSMILPVPETIDRFEKENDELIEKFKTASRKKQELEDEKKQAEQELNALLLKEDVPQIADLEALRKDRDLGWALIKQKYIQQLDISNTLSAYTQEIDLPTVYEKKIRQADNISDRLRLDADQVVKRAELEAQIDSMVSQINELSTVLEKTKKDQTDFNIRWTDIWKSLNIIAGTPREMKQWLLKAERLIEKIQTVKAVSTNKEKLSEACDQLKKLISNQIFQFNPLQKTKEKRLEALISLCEQRIEKEQKERDKRREIELSLKDSGIRLKRTQDELKTVKNDLMAWSDEWKKAIDGLSLKTDVHPETVTEIVDNLVLFFQKFDQSEELRKRIYGMDKVKENFHSKVYEFAKRIEFKTDDQDALTIAALLHRDLNAAREARASLIKIKDQLDEKEQDIQAVNITIRHSQEKIIELKKQARTETDGALIKAAERSNNKRDLLERIETLEQELNRNGDGLSIAALEEELNNCEIDAIEAETEKISIELNDLQSQRDNLRDQRRTIQDEIKEKDGNALAANASAQSEEHLAGIAQHAEHYLRFQIGALILEQQIESYRKENQAPVLGRAGELFSTLTLGSYAGLRDELDSSGKPILLGVRPDDHEVAIAGMSDGSRDQLYLALRLATLEQHIKKEEPMPFVVDDILIGFDDDRTCVCLEVLAQLSTNIQVLLFTHHQRVLELAMNCNESDRIFQHRLS